MPNPAIVSIDTETLGLAVHHPIWELALIRREPDGAQVEHHWYVRHDPTKGDPSLPDGFRADYEARYQPEAAIDAFDLGVILRHLLRPVNGQQPILIGSNPSFDADRIALHVGKDIPGLWHYRTICVATLAAGWIAGRRSAERVVTGPPEGVLAPPWKSDDLAATVGVKAGPHRHTALGDCRWALAVWDSVMGS